MLQEQSPIDNDWNTCVSYEHTVHPISTHHVRSTSLTLGGGCFPSKAASRAISWTMKHTNTMNNFIGLAGTIQRFKDWGLLWPRYLQVSFYIFHHEIFPCQLEVIGEMVDEPAAPQVEKWRQSLKHKAQWRAVARADALTACLSGGSLFPGWTFGGWCWRWPCSTHTHTSQSHTWVLSHTRCSSSSSSSKWVSAWGGAAAAAPARTSRCSSLPPPLSAPSRASAPHTHTHTRYMRGRGEVSAGATLTHTHTLTSKLDVTTPFSRSVFHFTLTGGMLATQTERKKAGGTRASEGVRE